MKGALLSNQAGIILDPNSSNRGIKIRINSTDQTGFVPGMLLSPVGDLSHTSILYYYEIYVIML
jgi:hypothetical protein